MRFATRLAGGALVAGLLGAACGGGSSNPAPPTALAGGTKTSVASTERCPASAGLGSIHEHGSQRATGTDIALDAGDSFFAPTCVTAVAPGKVSVTLKNTGAALHNFSVPERGIDIDVAPGKTVRVEVDVDSPSVTFFCKYHRTSGMVGALIQGTT